MTRYVVILALSLAPVGAQSPEKIKISSNVAAAPITVTHIPQGMLANLERTFDIRLFDPALKEPFDELGDGTRGLYLPGYGTIFTTQLSLIVTPGDSPFRPGGITAAFKLAVHDRKAAQLPKLQDLMKDLVKVTALTLLPMQDDDKIVYAVRVRYLPWENTDGLPAQIVMSATKKTAQTGDIKTVIE